MKATVRLAGRIVGTGRIAHAFAKAMPTSRTGRLVAIARMINPVWAGCVSASDALSKKWLKKNGHAFFRMVEPGARIFRPWLPQFHGRCRIGQLLVKRR